MPIGLLRRARYAALLFTAALPAQGGFTMAQVKSNPFPNELAAASAAPRIAWAFNEQGKRNVYAAEGPTWTARPLTDFTLDDGQELTSLQLSSDGKWVVFVRGGEHGGNWAGPPPNPLALPIPPKVQIWAAPFSAGGAKVLAEGDDPVITPTGDRVAFLVNGQPWIVPIDGSAAPKRLFQTSGSVSDLQYSPDGKQLAFVSNRGDHAFIGIFVDDQTPLRWIDPGTYRDGSPRWSPSGTRLAFIRRPGSGGAPGPVLTPRHQPWAIWSADVATGATTRLWQAPTTLRGSPPSTQGGTNLYYAALGRITFLSYVDGWPHLYSIAETGGEPLLLTPGNYMAEYISLSPDGKQLYFAGNTGPDTNDIDRRHVVRVPVDRAAPEVLTPGSGSEWTPVALSDGAIAYIGGSSQRPPLPMVRAARSTATIMLGAERVPADFPSAKLVTPKKVVYKASDGVSVHAQLFEPPTGGSGKKPAIIFVHGGPPRQMLLTWHYSDYYSATYAMNQYLASRGFVVLSVNYRLGIGYGFDFHRPADAGAQGASEYLDVKAGAEWLRAQPNIDPARIGIYGGSYGGFLTALALGKNSDLFAAGVDIHGVHDFTTPNSGAGAALAAAMTGGRMEGDDRAKAQELAWTSSPIAYVSQWKSPVLLIHGDEDRNVRFSQTVDLVARLKAQGVEYEELVIPDDTHHWMRHANGVRVYDAAAAYFERKLMKK